MDLILAISYEIANLSNKSKGTCWNNLRISPYIAYSN